MVQHRRRYFTTLKLHIMCCRHDKYSNCSVLQHLIMAYNYCRFIERGPTISKSSTVYCSCFKFSIFFDFYLALCWLNYFDRTSTLENSTRCVHWIFISDGILTQISTENPRHFNTRFLLATRTDTKINSSLFVYFPPTTRLSDQCLPAHGQYQFFKNFILFCCNVHGVSCNHRILLRRTLRDTLRTRIRYDNRSFPPRPESIDFQSILRVPVRDHGRVHRTGQTRSTITIILLIAYCTKIPNY